MKTRLDEMRRIKSIGDVSELRTENTDNVVVAINEIKTESDLKVGCKDYDGSSGVNIPPISSGIGGVGVTPVGLQFKWVGTKLGIKRENAYTYLFSDLKGEPGEQGRDGVPGARGDRGRKGEDGFPSKLDWMNLLERIKVIESLNDIQPNYEHAEITYIADILTASDRTVNIRYGILSTASVIRHELSIDGGKTFNKVNPTYAIYSEYYELNHSFSEYNIGDRIPCVIRSVTSIGEYIDSNIFNVIVSDSDISTQFEFNLDVTDYEIRNNEDIIIGFNSNKNIANITLSIDGGPYYYKGIIEGDRVIFITGRIINKTYSCRMQVQFIDDEGRYSDPIETDSFNVNITDDMESLPIGNDITLSSLEPRKYINTEGSVDKRSLAFRFTVNKESISEARYFYYSVDGSSYTPLKNVKYLGNGVFESHISWVFDPYNNRRLEVLASRLNIKSAENNKATIIKEFVQDYDSEVVIPEMEG